MEKLRSKTRFSVVLSLLLVLSGLCLAACGDDEETGPGNSGASGGDGDGDGDGDSGEGGDSGNGGDGDGDGDAGECGDSGNGGDGDGDSGEGGESGNGGDGDGDGDGDVEACLDAEEPTTNEEILNRPCPPTECEPFDNEDRLPFYDEGDPLPDSLD